MITRQVPLIVEVELSHRSFRHATGRLECAPGSQTDIEGRSKWIYRNRFGFSSRTFALIGSMSSDI